MAGGSAPTRIVLIRGINLGKHNRVPMAELRAELSAAGYANVRTYIASGNVLVDSDESAERLVQRVGALLASRFGLQVPVVTRTQDELERVIAANPIPAGAATPKLYQVSFLDREPPAGLLERLRPLALGTEQIAHLGRELYSWHPEGIARSKLASGIASAKLGVIATARNWTTVQTLAEMARAQP